MSSNPRKPSSPSSLSLSGFKKLDITRREFCRQCIRIWNMKIGVPAGNALFDISCVVRHGIHTNGLQNDHRRTSLDNAEEDVVVTGSLKRDVEPETVAIKRQRYGNILYNEEWRNAGNFCFSSYFTKPCFRLFNIVKKINCEFVFVNFIGDSLYCNLVKIIIWFNNGDCFKSKCCRSW